ncbi:MAG TPA: DUF2842 domain-containing protein [Phenylobacterium sp.]
MSKRIRKLIGLAAISAFMVAYVAVAVMVADYLPDNRIAELAYFVIAGTFWFLPIVPLLYWMNRGSEGEG